MVAKTWYRRPDEACGNAGDTHPAGSRGIAWEQTPQRLWGQGRGIGSRCCEAMPETGPDPSSGSAGRGDFVHSPLPSSLTACVLLWPMAPFFTGRTSLGHHISLDAVASCASLRPGKLASDYAITLTRRRIRALPCLRRHACNLAIRKGSPAVAAPSQIRQLSSAHSASSVKGPNARYDELVSTKVLRDDDHQRSIIALLQSLHDELKGYQPPNARAPLGHKHEESRGFVSVMLLEPEGRWV